MKRIARPAAFALAVASCWVVYAQGFVSAQERRTLARKRLVPREPSGAYVAPQLAFGPAGEVWCVFLAFDGSSDSIRARRVRPMSEEQPLLLSGDLRTCFEPRLVGDEEGRLYVVFAARGPEGYDLYLCERGGDGWSAPLRITTDAAADTAPAVAVRDGVLWVAWETFRDGQFDIYARVREAGEWGAAVRVSEHPATDVQPTLGFAPDGAPWIAWTSFRHGDYRSGNYEVYARRLDGESGAVRVTRSPEAEAYPRLVPGSDPLALAWTAGSFPLVELEALRATAYDAWEDKRYRVAWLDDGAWSGPTEAGGASGAEGAVCESFGAVAPIGPSAPGEVWLLHEEVLPEALGTKNARELRLRRVRPGSSTDPVALSDGELGIGRAPSAVATEAGCLVATAVSRVPEDGRFQLRLLSVDAAHLRAEWRAATAAEPRERDAERPDLSAGPAERAVLEHGVERWQAYFGNLHVHTDFSSDGNRGDAPPLQNLRWLRDVAGLDFAALTDHARDLTEYERRVLFRLTELWNRPGDFVALHGFEWSSRDHGHKNVVFADARAATGPPPPDAKLKSPRALFRSLAGRAAIAIPHHTSHGSLGPTDWSFADDGLQRLMEVFQRRGSYEYDGAALQRGHRVGRWNFFPGHGFQDALRAGHHLGVIASPDHGGGLGLAGVWAASLDGPALFEGLHARRTFGTTGAKMVLWLEINGALQGEIVTQAEADVFVRGEVRGTAPGLELVLVGPRGDVAESSNDGLVARIEWSGRLESSDESWFYLRAVQSDGHIGWTSPVWVRAAP